MVNEFMGTLTDIAICMTIYATIWVVIFGYQAVKEN